MISRLFRGGVLPSWGGSFSRLGVGLSDLSDKVSNFCLTLRNFFRIQIRKLISGYAEKILHFAQQEIVL